MTKRPLPKKRQRQLLDAGLVLAGRIGYTRITGKQVAEYIGVSGPVIQYHFGNMTLFLAKLMAHAIKNKNNKVICQGILFNEVDAKSNPELHRAIKDLIKRCKK